MGLLDDYSGPGGGLAGIGMTPRPKKKHQEFMSAMECYLKIKFFGTYNVLSESAIDYMKLSKSKAPDVMISTLDDTAVTFIDITTTYMKSKIIEKCGELMEKYNVQESFVYDYQKDNWTKLILNPKKVEISSWSNTLNLDITDSFIWVLNYKKPLKK